MTLISGEAWAETDLVRNDLFPAIGVEEIMA